MQYPVYGKMIPGSKVRISGFDPDIIKYRKRIQTKQAMDGRSDKY